MTAPLREIDMADPANFQKAVDLAVAATERSMLWTAWSKDGEETLVVAVTGNGPTSRANAEFFASARKVVLGLISEVDRLRTIARNAGVATRVRR